MIKEFALDPDAITSSYREFCYFTEKFGVSQGRVISAFPKKWRKLVCDSALREHKGKVEFSKIVERLNKFGNDIVFDTGRPSGEGSQTWIDRALVEHARKPFAAIISATAIDHPDVLLKDEIDEENPRFKAARQCAIPRTAQALIGCAEFLIRHAKIIKLVDPHFDPTKLRYQRPLEQICSLLPGSKAIVEIHRSDEIANDELIRRFQQSVFMLPSGVKMQLHIYEKAQMHNRFIITESGGLIYGVGLSDNEDGGGAPDEEVTLMETAVKNTRWNDYSKTSPVAIWP
ncbi:hypothetical protein [Candidatus Nitrotoga sp. AM1P]|uniref:hypothetical protein n=1 Tax=Candidatus Nitrotoga sp. AM1P TaxID=2559597 RepID=UPI0010B3D3C2|nr:hypothetical protein [Candidatus Nitrotoga sp. AM1P]BBJ22342.1 hypothetical protein W01_02690 [Candidatus Nitrotoga sp. AM1P]